MAERKTEEAKRLELQALFEDFLGSRNVYFQPPRDKQLNYPCILYFKSTVHSRNADDKTYIIRQGYTVTIVDYDPDSQLPFDFMERFNLNRIDSSYRSDGLNHTKLTLYY